MEREGGTDLFELLEKKIDSLIEHIHLLQDERNTLLEKIKVQDERIALLDKESEALKSTRNAVRQRISSLLQKMENLEL